MLGQQQARIDSFDEVEKRVRIIETELKLVKVSRNNDESLNNRLQRQVRDVHDEFQEAIRQVNEIEKTVLTDLKTKVQLLEQ